MERTAASDFRFVFYVKNLSELCGFLQSCVHFLSTKM